MIKKIAFLSTESNMSGATLALLEIIDALNSRGIEPIVFTALRGPLEDELKKRKVRFFKLFFFCCLVCDGELNTLKGKLKFFIKRALAYISEKKVKKILAIESPDIFHINTGVSSVGIDSAKKLNIPIVWHRREIPEICWNRHAYDYEKEQEYLKKVNSVVCISKFVYSHYVKKTSDNIVVIYDGVNTVGFESIRKKEILSSDEIQLALCGTGAVKGHEDAIKALGILCKEGYENLKLTFWGNIDEEYKKNLENMIVAEEIEDRVVFGGFSNNISQVWANTDVALMCSRGEAFGRVTIEALAAGTLVIGANCGATPELLGDNSEILYEPYNPNDLANKIKWLINHREFSIEITKRMQKQVVDGMYSLDNYIESLMDLYHSLV